MGFLDLNFKKKGMFIQANPYLHSILFAIVYVLLFLNNNKFQLKLPPRRPFPKKKLKQFKLNQKDFDYIVVYYIRSLRSTSCGKSTKPPQIKMIEKLKLTLLNFANILS